MLGAATTRILQIPESILHTQRLDFLHPPVSSKDQSKRLIRLVYNGLRRPLFVNNYSCDGPGEFFARRVRGPVHFGGRMLVGRLRPHGGAAAMQRPALSRHYASPNLPIEKPAGIPGA